MNRCKLRAAVFALLACLAGGLSLQAQVGFLLGGELRLGGSYIIPNENASHVSVGSATGLSLDYTHHLGDHFAWNINYLYSNLDVRSTRWLPPYAGIKESFGVQSFTFSLQFAFLANSRWNPYVGAGFNVLYTPSSPGKEVWIGEGPGGFLATPAGGFGSGTIGTAFQAGVTCRLSGPLLFDINAKYMDNGLRMDKYLPYQVGGALHLVRSGSYTLRLNPVVLTASIGFRW
ncbi:MAG: hypothetical protein B7X11_01080 [Acidobacteria bacterium 37-65-4]|nr:MAG: hypothetical protein B7X11_01080 [Acidobacteria bacterium 37-65-4]